MSLAYTSYFTNLESLFSDAIALVQRSGSTDCNSLAEKMVHARSRLYEEAPLRVVLVGEFNAGKSSIIAALTGAEVPIDADVATIEVAEYPWRGLVLVDTPGVQAEDTGTDHDRIARKAAVSADLVLFVITNELFNPRLAEHLRFILDDGGLALSKKTCVVMNKVDRETNPDETLITEVAKVLGPHQDVPIFLCSASMFLQAAKESATLRARFERDSRFRDLIGSLDQFVSDAGMSGRLTTPLSVVCEVLDAVQSAMAGCDDDRKQLELIRRQRLAIQRLQRRLHDIRKTWKQQAYSAVMAQANDAVKQLSEISQEDHLEELFNAGLKQAESEIDQLYDSIEGELQEALDKAKAELDEIGGSPLGQFVARIQTERAEKVGIDFSTSRPGGANYGPKIAKAVSKPLQEGLDAAAKNAKGLRDVVYKVVKACGGKFRPHGPTKAGEALAKAAGKAGKAVPFFAAALDFYIQYREEKAKEEKERYFAKLRLALRAAFADQAAVEAKVFEAVVLDVSRGSVTESLDGLDKRAEEIVAGGEERTSLQSEIGRLKSRCSALRDEFYCGS